MGVEKWRGKRTAGVEGGGGERGKVVERGKEERGQLRATRARTARTESHVADIIGVVQSRKVADLERRLAVRVENLRCRLARGPPTRVHELLEEHLAKDAIRLLLENGAEDDSDPVGGRLDVDRFLGAARATREWESRGGRAEDVPVVNAHQLLLCHDSIGGWRVRLKMAL